MGEVDKFREAVSLISSWKPTSDVFALKYFAVATGALGGVSGYLINSHYRRMVKLRSKVFIATTLPVVFLPVFSSTLMHHQFVQYPLVMQQYQCPICLELRGGIIQAFCGFIYPMVLAPAAAFHFAGRLYTYNIPSFSDPKELWKTYVKLTRPALSRFYVLAVIQFVAGMALTHAEAYNLFTIISKLSAMQDAINDHKATQKTIEF